jgi:hypothetical protein
VSVRKILESIESFMIPWVVELIRGTDSDVDGREPRAL